MLGMGDILAGGCWLSLAALSKKTVKQGARRPYISTFMQQGAPDNRTVSTKVV